MYRYSVLLEIVSSLKLLFNRSISWSIVEVGCLKYKSATTFLVASANSPSGSMILGRPIVLKSESGSSFQVLYHLWTVLGSSLRLKATALALFFFGWIPTKCTARALISLLTRAPLTFLLASSSQIFFSSFLFFFEWLLFHFGIT